MKNNKNSELLWAKHKYEVMWHSQKYYLSIREMLKSPVTLDEIESEINKAKQITPTKGSIINTYDHMWGYFKKISDKEEKTTYLLLKDQFLNDNIEPKELLHFIKFLSEKYQTNYILNSTIISELEI